MRSEILNSSISLRMAACRWPAIRVIVRLAQCGGIRTPEAGDARRLFYSVSTCPGHSGSAVTTDRGHGPEIIGVHTTGILDTEGRSYGCVRGSVLAPANLLNSGVRLTPANLDAILHPTAARRGGVVMVRLL